MSIDSYTPHRFESMHRALWIFSMVTVLIVGAITTMFAGKYVDRIQRTLLIDQAETIAASVDTNDIRRLSGTSADIGTEDYNGLKENLAKIRSVNTGARFVYVMGYRGDHLFFYADSEPADSPDYSAPGDMYTEASKEKISSLLHGTSFAEGPYTDRWGQWVSGYASVLDPETNALIAGVGIDISARQWEREIWYAEILSGSITLLIFILLLLIYRFHRRRVAFVKQLDEEQGRIRTLYEITTTKKKALGDQFRAALSLGAKTLGTTIAVLSHIENGMFTVEYCVAPPDELREGDVFNLDETYCDITVKKDDVLSINEMRIDKHTAHACYRKFKLEAYIGVPVKIFGDLHGTLAFMAPDPHRPAFTDSDRDFVRLMGKWMSTSLEREQIERMKSEFVSVASHQLRTPLTGIKWFVELLLKGSAGKLSTEQTDFITQVKDSNNRMIALVEDLLNVSRIETGRKFSIVLKPTDITPIIQSTVAEAAILGIQRNIQLVIDQTFPKSLLLNIDGDKIRQVIHNLLTNAIKYSPDTSIVTVNCNKEKKGNIVISVKDSGVGIPKAQQTKIFQKFFRAENVLMTGIEGTGLGLYIAKAIVEGHKGRIWFESEEGKGTTFYVALPISQNRANTSSLLLNKKR